MGSIVKGMDKVLKSMDTEQLTAVMDKFEKQFEDMDVKSAYMEVGLSLIYILFLSLSLCSLSLVQII